LSRKSIFQDTRNFVMETFVCSFSGTQTRRVSLVLNVVSFLDVGTN
jgi:hypothetical protein